MKSLNELRKEIDEIDLELLKILAKRVDAVKQIGQVKDVQGIPIVDETRREKLLKAVKEKAKALGISEDFVGKLFEIIHDHAVELQKK
jgi:chorismate mutase-like protein